jgi:hypothetical protein
MTNSPSQIRICIGTEPKTEIARKVLQYSIKKHTQSNVVFYPMLGETWAKFSERKLGVGTGFSLQRWNIPRMFGYAGAAIYLDADQLVFEDIADLWARIPVDGCIACTFQTDKWFKKEKKPNTSVMVMDCEYCKNDPGWLDGEELISYLKKDKDRKRYVEVMHALHLKVTVKKLPTVWNHLNEYHAGKTKLIHYTVEHQQPWYVHNHPHAAIWGEYLFSSICAGEVSYKEVLDACRAYKPACGSCRAEGMDPYWAKFITNKMKN